MRFEPDLFDKLFYNAPDSSTVRKISLDELKNSVARNIESILNTRMIFSEEYMTRFPECTKSILTYGLNDFTGLSLSNSAARDAIGESIRVAIKRHEPRLVGAEVTLEQRPQSIGGLQFAIKAMLVVHPAREPVSFDAQFQATTGQYSVSRAGGRRPGAIDG
ncbi:type VI secretion system baseplate subunit TssE [Paraburkholderia sp. A2WS-5]|uniref:type VI secretion system baseplate subunit TssE n=1 Tax=unclassified Paraburkholderia TaxID=2615204 RepID=UPI003B79D4D0